MAAWILPRSTAIVCSRTNNVGDSLYSNISCADTAGTPNNGLNFGSGNAYVDFGDPAALGLAPLPRNLVQAYGGWCIDITGSGGIVDDPLGDKWNPRN